MRAMFLAALILSTPTHYYEAFGVVWVQVSWSASGEVGRVALDSLFTSDTAAVSALTSFSPAQWLEEVTQTTPITRYESALVPICTNAPDNHGPLRQSALVEAVWDSCVARSSLQLWLPEQRPLERIKFVELDGYWLNFEGPTKFSIQDYIGMRSYNEVIRLSPNQRFALDIAEGVEFDLHGNRLMDDTVGLGVYDTKTETASRRYVGEIVDGFWLDSERFVTVGALALTWDGQYLTVPGFWIGNINSGTLRTFAGPLSPTKNAIFKLKSSLENR